MKTKRLVLFGTGDLASIAYEYFNNDSEYEVVAFTVDRDYVKESSFLGLPLIPFEDLPQFYSPKEHHIHVCVVYGNLNRDRAGKCAQAKDIGYELASYISSCSFVSPCATIGEHAFIFEANVIQPGVVIGNNCILWSGNHIGHHSGIAGNVFVSSHVVISGRCVIGENVFIGVNSTIANNVSIGMESWISHGCLISSDIPPNSFVKSPSEITKLNEAALQRSLSRHRK